MTSSHGSSNSHSNSPGITHSNSTGSLGHGNYGDHAVTYLGETYENSFPIDPCVSSLTILYNKSETLRKQFNNLTKKSSILPSMPSTLQLGDKTNSSSLLYKLLNNGVNSQVLPAIYRFTYTLDNRTNSINKSGHANYAANNTHSNHTNTGHSNTVQIAYRGDNNYPSFKNDYNRNVDFPIGNAKIQLTPGYVAFTSNGITSETISGNTTTGNVATKSTVTSLIKIFNKYIVKTSLVHPTDLGTFNVSNYISGHSNYNSHGQDASKREYKTNIEDYNESALDKINDVKIVKFNYLPKIGDSTIDRVGFIADDTDEIFSTHYHDRMDYMNCIGMLMKGVQELTEQVKILEQKVKEKETEVKELKEIILKNEN